MGIAGKLLEAELILRRLARFAEADLIRRDDAITGLNERGDGGPTWRRRNSCRAAVPRPVRWDALASRPCKPSRVRGPATGSETALPARDSRNPPNARHKSGPDRATRHCRLVSTVPRLIQQRRRGVRRRPRRIAQEASREELAWSQGFVYPRWPQNSTGAR